MNFNNAEIPHISSRSDIRLLLHKRTKDLIYTLTIQYTIQEPIFFYSIRAISQLGRKFIVFLYHTLGWQF